MPDAEVQKAILFVICGVIIVFLPMLLVAVWNIQDELRNIEQRLKPSPRKNHEA